MSRRLPFDVLSDGSLVLTLSESCIQTTARRAHRDLAEMLLSGPSPGRVVEARFDLLGRFLAATDFARLRAEHPELAGGSPCRVRLFSDGDGAVRWEVVQAE
jgi:hypothetical protein